MKRLLVAVALVGTVSCEGMQPNAVVMPDGSGGPFIYHTVVDSARGIECWTTGAWANGGGDISCVQVR